VKVVDVGGGGPELDVCFPRPRSRNGGGHKKITHVNAPGAVTSVAQSRSKAGNGVALPFRVWAWARDGMGACTSYLDFMHTPPPPYPGTSRPSLDITGVLGADRPENCAHHTAGRCRCRDKGRV
jgi:hypothetical protein